MRSVKRIMDVSLDFGLYSSPKRQVVAFLRKGLIVRPIAFDGVRKALFQEDKRFHFTIDFSHGPRWRIDQCGIESQCHASAGKKKNCSAVGLAVLQGRGDMSAAP